METNNGSIGEHFHFWKWLLTDGLRQFVDKWVLFHLILGYCLQLFLKIPLYEVAMKAFAPFSALLIALVFAWSGSVSSILQAKEMNDIRKINGFMIFKNYVFNFQLATLLNFILIISWIFLSLDPFKGHQTNQYIYTSIRTIVYAFSSLVIRECWNMILRLQLHLISIALIRDKDDTRGE